MLLSLHVFLISKWFFLRALLFFFFLLFLNCTNIQGLGVYCRIEFCSYSSQIEKKTNWGKCHWAASLFPFYISLALLVLLRSRTVRAQCHFLSLLPYSSTPVFYVFCLFFFSPFWGLPPDTCLLPGSGGQIRFVFWFLIT